MRDDVKDSHAIHVRGRPFERSGRCSELKMGGARAGCLRFSDCQRMVTADLPAVGGLRSTEGGQPCTCNRGVLAIERLLSIAGMTINECHKGRIGSVKHPGQIQDGFLPTQRQSRPFRCLRYTLIDPVSSSWKHDIRHAPVPLV